MRLFQDLAAECRADRAFAAMVVALGFWSASSLALLVLNLLDLFPSP